MLWKYFNLVVNNFVYEQINCKMIIIIFCNKSKCVISILWYLIFYYKLWLFVCLFACLKGQLAMTLQDRVSRGFSTGCLPRLLRMWLQCNDASILPDKDGWTVGQSTNTYLFYDLLLSAVECALWRIVVLFRKSNSLALGGIWKGKFANGVPF